MSDNPILNSPYDEPRFHDDGYAELRFGEVSDDIRDGKNEIITEIIVAM